jgi:hypothetical protein
MGPSVKEQWTWHDDIIGTTRADIHNKVIRAYTKTAFGTTSIQPEPVIAVVAPIRAEDTIDLLSERPWLDPQGNCPLGWQDQWGAHQRSRAIKYAIKLKCPSYQPCLCSQRAIDKGPIELRASGIACIDISGPPGQYPRG